MAALFVARWIRGADQPGRLAGTTLCERQIATLLIPRGLIKAVLALDAIRAMKPQLDFLTPLAFASSC